MSGIRIREGKMVINMEDQARTLEQREFDEILAEGKEEELSELKDWLCQENKRIQAEKKDLKRKADKLSAERNQFEEEMDKEKRQLDIAQRIFKQDQAFFDKKMAILRDGFIQLNADQEKLEKEKVLFEAEKNARDDFSAKGNNTELAKMLFQGVNSLLALKKRYKDLIKMYHPDNVAGDHGMVLVINNVYEELRQEFELEMRA